MKFLATLKKGFRENLEREHIALFFALLGILLWLLIFDILSKYFAFQNLSAISGKAVMDAIPGLFNFVLVGNKGAAWGALRDQKWLLTMVSLLAGTGVLAFYLFRFARLKRVVSVSLILIVAGAYGNLIDRIGYWAQLGIYKDGVVDFLQFAFWESFPVFNLADSYLVVGIAILIVYYFVVLIREAIAKNKGTTSGDGHEEDLSQLVKKTLDKEDDDGKNV